MHTSNHMRRCSYNALEKKYKEETKAVIVGEREREEVEVGEETKPPNVTLRETT